MYSACKKHGHNQEKTPIFAPRSYISSLGIMGVIVLHVITKISIISMKIGGDTNAKNVKARQGRMELLPE